MKKEPRAHSFHCRFCGGDRSTTFNTYKHLWVSCDNCGNIHRQQKTRYCFEFIPRGVFEALPRGMAFSSLLLNTKKSGADCYDYYLDQTQEQKITAQGTKWEGQAARLVQELGRYGIDVHGRTVLDISGGPGFVVQELAPICKTAVVTEYSQASVDRMTKQLGIRARRYDFNTDDIDRVMPADTFDTVLIRYAVNFCLDVRKMLSSLKNILSGDAVIYVSFVPPTLGTCLRFQFDDYPYLVLYNPETLAKLFAEEGFVAFAQYSDGSDPYLKGVTPLLHPMMIGYRALNRRKNGNRELIQKNLVMIFRKNPNACW